MATAGHTKRIVNLATDQNDLTNLKNLYKMKENLKRVTFVIFSFIRLNYFAALRLCEPLFHTRVKSRKTGQVIKPTLPK